MRKIYTVMLALIIALTSTVQMSASADESTHSNIYMNEAGTFGVEVNYEKVDETFSKLQMSEVKANEEVTYKLRDIILDSNEDLGNWTYIVEDNKLLNIEVLYEDEEGNVESYKFDLIIASDVNEMPEELAEAFVGQTEVEPAEEIVEAEEVEEKSVIKKALSAIPMPKIQSRALQTGKHKVTLNSRSGYGSLIARIDSERGLIGYSYGEATFSQLILDGNEIVYCIEPTVSPARTQNGYSVKLKDLSSVVLNGKNPARDLTKKMTDKLREDLELTIKYGYGYPGHNTQEWSLSTQYQVWQAVGWDIEVTHSADMKSKHAQYTKEVERLKSLYRKNPSWNGTTVRTSKYDGIYTLTDPVLEVYDVESVTGGKLVSRTKDSITVQVTGNNELAKVTLVDKKNPTMKNGESIVVRGEPHAPEDPNLDKTLYSQRVLAARVSGSKKLTLNVTRPRPVLDESIKQSTSGAPISSVVFEVLDTDKNVVDTITTDSKGNIRWKGEPGKYFLREKSAPAPYVISKDLISVELEYGRVTSVGSVINKEAEGVIKILKEDEHGKKIEGTTFEVKDSSGKVVDTITTGADGYAKSKELPLGDYTLVEVSTPAHLQLDDKPIPVKIAYKDFNTPVIEVEASQSNRYQRTNLNLTKVEDNWDEIQTQYNGQTLEGVEIALYAAEDIYEGDKLIHKKDAEVGKKVTDKDGKITFNELSLGKYYAKELKTIEGFQLFEGKWDFNLTYDADNPKVLVTETNETLENQTIYGKARLVKHDEKWTLLEGATFGVFTKEGEKLMELKSNFAGRIVTPELRYGEYYFQEIEAPEGYWLDSKKIPFTISEQDEIVELTAPNYKIKAKLLVNKTDSETGEPLEGAKFKIWDLQANDWVTIKYADGMNVIEKDEWVTDENGQFLMEATIPYGKYQLIETEAPEGFVVHDPIDINIDKDQDYIELEVIGVILPTDVGNDPIRSDIKVLKVDKNTGEALPGFKFKLTNMETEEEFILESDEDGFADFGSHRYGMYMVEEIEVAGEYLIDKTPQFINITEHDTVYEVTFENEKPVGELLLTKEDFKDGTPVAGAEYGLFDLNDELVHKDVTDEEGKIVFKDIPLGKYYVKELVSPKNYVLDENEYHVSVDYIDDVTPVIHLEQSVKEWRVPEVGTTAAFVERDKAEPNIVTLVDEVRYENLVPGREYVVEGFLMNKETNEPIIIDGEKVTGRTEFVAETIDGMVEVYFTFDQNKLKTDTVVVFEDLYEDEIVVASHHDINDEGQTVEIPEVGTTASFVEIDKNEPNIATIVDEVRYEGLVIGEKYEVTGVLMDKETGEPIIIDGEEVTGRTEFIAESTSGVVEVEFTLDLNELKTDTVVVFEDLYNGERLIAVHHDINDEEQTVEIPNVGTKASYAGLDKDKPNIATIVDQVFYEGLVIGKEYEVTGVLMDKETSEPVIIDGKQVEGSTKFVAEETSGMVEVEFTFDLNKLKTDTVVVFEDLYDGERLIAIHHDINDEEQTVEIPEIGTTASLTDIDEETNMVTINDRVRYTNLEVGKKYRVTGHLMDKHTNTPILVDGKLIESEVEFVAESTDGFIDVEFTFDRSKVKTDTIVVFESLYDAEGTLTAVHHDINDEGQTVKIPQPVIPTGDNHSALLLSVALLSMAAAKLVIDRKKKEI